MQLPRPLSDFLRARLDRDSELGLLLTVNVLLFTLAVWAFGGLLEEVLDNEGLVRWDRAVNLWFHAHATPAGSRLFSLVTEIGSPVAWTVVVLAALWLLRRRRHFDLLAWVASNVGGWLLQNMLKLSIHRSRPQYAAAYLYGHSYSFPSGHAMTSAICYTLLVFVLTDAAGWTPRRRAPLYAASTALVLAIAFSRVYLGVHYPSDVLGGLAAGTAWVVLCLTAIGIARARRGR